MNKEYGITYPKGFKGAGIHSGIKKEDKDLALIYSEVPAVVSGVFTKNRVKAAPVLISQEVVNQGVGRAIIINSGNANACTGEQGFKDGKTMQSLTGKALNISPEAVMVASTGVIGVPLDMGAIANGIPQLATCLGTEKNQGQAVAKAILTTDTFEKQFVREFQYQGKTIKLGGVCKGSGMIHPNMATTLGFVTTDLAIEKSLLDQVLRQTIETTFNCISIDGDTSTNDMVLVMANGMSHASPIKDEKDSGYESFKIELESLLKEMAKSIVKDGEGASKFIEIEVKNAKTVADAIKIGKSIATSSLVKTASFGEDANWGRILAAAGYSGVDFDPDETDIQITSPLGSLPVCQGGQGLDFDEAKAKTILGENALQYTITIKEGRESATVYTCDLSYEYVKINSDYRS